MKDLDIEVAVKQLEIMLGVVTTKVILGAQYGEAPLPWETGDSCGPNNYQIDVIRMASSLASAITASCGLTSMREWFQSPNIRIDGNFELVSPSAALRSLATNSAPDRQSLIKRLVVSSKHMSNRPLARIA
jgi:hypothetical protein